jgi:hypothetical protein
LASAGHFAQPIRDSLDGPGFSAPRFHFASNARVDFQRVILQASNVALFLSALTKLGRLQQSVGT